VRVFLRIIVCLTCVSLPSPHPLPLSQRARGEICKSPVITLGELYTWALRKNAPPKYLESLMAFLSDVIVLDVTQDVAQAFGTIRAQLFDQGVTISGMDLMIAATALVRESTLVTHNTKHFNNIPGLRIVDWLEA
jgi:tRNA(fMet)-specific endonuclease VapC